MTKQAIGWSWAAFIVVAAAFLLYMFFFIEIDKAKPVITLKDNFNQTVFISVADDPTPDVKTIASEDVVKEAVPPPKMGSGSGVLVAPRFVLTSCHVVIEDSCQNWDNLKPYSKIKLLVGGQTHRGTVVHFNKPFDLALVMLTDMIMDVIPASYTCERLSFDRRDYYAIGYPFRMGKNIKSGKLAQPQGSFMGDLGFPKYHKPWESAFDGDDADLKKRGKTRQDYIETVSENYANEQAHLRFFNQLDISLLPGNSGGGVYDDEGKLVGIVSNIIMYPAEGKAQMPMMTPSGPTMALLDSMAMIPAGYTHVTKPERICEFLNSYKGVR